MSPFRLLDLPAELRLRIYTYILAPTHSIQINYDYSTASYKKNPTISPELLQVNKKVHAEAKRIYYEANTFFLPSEVFEKSWPIIDLQMREEALPKLRSLFIVLELNSRRTPDFDPGEYLEPLDAMVALKSLRVLMVDDKDDDAEAVAELCRRIWQGLRERVPKGCVVRYGCSTQEELTYVRDYVGQCEVYRSLEGLVEVSGSFLS